MPAGRPQNILRPVKLTTYLPEDLRAQLDMHLFSSTEGRVPHGAYSTFLAERVREFFNVRPAPKEVATEAKIRETEHVLALTGLLSEIALTDLRSGWTPEKIAQVVTRARQLTGKVPR